MNAVALEAARRIPPEKVCRFKRRTMAIRTEFWYVKALVYCILRILDGYVCRERCREHEGRRSAKVEHFGAL